MKKIILLATFTILAISAWAEQVNTTAGKLANDLTDNTISQLTVTGTIDARDFKFIADNLNNLTSIDLSNVQIVAYENASSPVFLDIISYDADAIPATAFMSKPLQSITFPTTLKKIGVATFAGCEQLDNITFPASLETIEPYAFSSCNACSDITNPENLSTLGEGAFSRCNNLTTVTINPTSDFVVGKDAFQDCKALSNLTLGNNVKAIGPGAFSGCTALLSPVITQGSNLEAIAEAAFAGSGVQNIDLYLCNNLKSIGMWAFANSSLKEIELPASLESLGNGAFYYNLDMEQIELPSSITSLSDYLLAGNNAITTQQPVQDGVTTIGDYAFYNWDQINSFVFPESVEYIGTKAMAGQTGLTSVIAHPTIVPELGEEVWAGVDQPSIPLTVNKEVTQDYRNAEQWKEFYIRTTPTSIDENIADATSSIKAYFTGTVLNVTASSAIASVAIFDTRGVVLAAATPGTDRTQLDTANFMGKFYIVAVALADGTKQSFKLVRE